MQIRSYLLSTSLVLALVATGTSWADSSTHSEAGSVAISNGSGQILDGSLEGIATSANYTLEAVHASADGVVWVLTNAADGSRATVKLSAKAAGTASTGIGQAIEISAIAAGWALSSAGQVIAYIPNELGKAMLSSSKL